jgi:hypothetical protein
MTLLLSHAYTEGRTLPIALGDEVQWTDGGVMKEGIAYDVSIDNGYMVINRDGRSSYLALAHLPRRQRVDR